MKKLNLTENTAKHARKCAGNTNLRLRDKILFFPFANMIRQSFLLIQTNWYGDKDTFLKS